MDSTLTEEEISCIKQKKPRIIFVIGQSGSGITLQMEKVSKEFKYSTINLVDLFNKECENNEVLKLAKEQELDIKKELLTKILVKGIIECPNKNIIIQGFPKKLEQALYFEQNVLPIKLLIYFNVSWETCVKRLTEKNKETPLEELEKNYNECAEQLKEIIDFYSPYGIIREIDANLSMDEVNTLFKQNFYPIIYSIIGKRYSGKTTLSKVLNAKTGISLCDFNEFKNLYEEIDSKVILDNFIQKLRENEEIRILIEDFPQNQEQYSYFVNNCKNFEKIYFLNADTATCLERLNDIDINDKNYTDCSTLDKMLTEFDRKQSFIDFLKKNAKILEINVNNHQILIEDLIIKEIQPYTAFIKIDAEPKLKDELFPRLKENYNCFEINLPNIIENGKKRKILPEDADIDSLSIDCKIQLIKPLLFREKCERVILNTFPLTMEELCEFEKNLCKINKFIDVTESHLLTHIIKDQNSMYVYFYNSNKFTILNPSEMTDYKIEETLDLTRDINIVYGMPMSGKTVIAKHLLEKYGFTSLDFKDLIEQVKKKKIDPENPDAEPEVSYEDLLNELKIYLDELPKNKRILIDNFYIPNAGETPFLIDTYEKAFEVIKTIGNFRNLYEIVCDEKFLVNRYKNKEGITEELNEDQRSAFVDSLEKPRKLLDDIKACSSNIIKINCEEPDLKSLAYFDFYFQKNFILVKHEYDIIIEKTLELFSAKNRLLYINIPKLIYSHFYKNNDFSKKLEGSYGKQKFKVEIKNPNDFDEVIFYKYNPINFEKNLINEMILNYVYECYKNIEYTGNYIILSGYLNYDLVENVNEPYNLPLLELQKVMQLGDLTALIQITRKDIKQIEDEEPIQLVIEKPKKVVKKEGEEGEEQPPEEPEEENPDAHKFKPEDYKWTNYDGIPRNYVQILKRLKNMPIKVVNIEENNETVREELIKGLAYHLDNFVNREESKYNGVIEIIKIDPKQPVPEEKIEEVYATSELVEKKREAEGSGNTGAGKEKAKAGGIPEIL